MVKPGLAARIAHRLRNYFLAGVLVTAPIGITLYLAWTLIAWVDNRVIPLLPQRFHPDAFLPFPIPGLGLVITVIAMILIGALTANILGRALVRLSERIVRRVPLIRSIHATIKQVFETVLSKQSKAFRKVVLVEYPRKGIWAIGFLTGETMGEVQNRTEDRLVNIFLPTTPNPTSGFLLFLPERDVIELRMTVEEGIKMVMSGGMVTPPDRSVPILVPRPEPTEPPRVPGGGNG